MRQRGLQELHESLRHRAVLGDHEQRARTKDRLAQILAGIGREVEEIGVLPDHGAFRKERRDERRLTVHVAARRRGKQPLRAVAEIGRTDRPRPALHIGVVAREPAEFVDRRNHLGIVEGQRVGHPAVIIGGRVDPQHHVLDPVGGRPAGGRARTQPDAPRRAAIGHDLLGQRLQLFHRGRHGVARVGKVFRRIPHQRFHIDLVEQAVKRLRAISPGVGCQIDPGLAGRVVVLDPGGGLGRQRRQLAALGQIGRQTGLRDHRDTGGRTRLDVDHHPLLEAVTADIFDRSAGGSGEIGHHRIEQILVNPAPGPVDLEALAFQIDRLQRIEIGPVEPGILTRREFQVLRQRATCQKRKRGSTCKQSRFHCDPPDYPPWRYQPAACAKTRLQTALDKTVMRQNIREST